MPRLSARDLKLAVRTLWRRPGFTLIAVLALAVGFGTNTAIFSIVSTLLLRPLPYPDADRLVTVSGKSRLAFEGQLFASPAEFVQWREANRVFDALVACASENVTLTLADQAEEVKTVSVSGDLFALLRVRPQLGQLLGEEDIHSAGATRILISDRLWRTLFAGDPQILGRPLQLNSQPVAIAGVMPSAFEFPSADADVWQPLRFTASQLTVPGHHYLDVYARLKPGITSDQGRRDLVDIVQRMERDAPDWLKRGSVDVTPLQETLTANIRPTLVMLLGIVTLVLVIACANVSHLLLARMVQRRREMALRTALGGSRGQIVWQVFLECLVLAATAATLGLLLAPLSLRALALLLQSERWSAATMAAVHTGLDWRLLLYTVAIAIAAVFIVGLGPAIRAVRVNLSEAFQDGSQHASESSRTRLARTLLIVAEVALTVVVLAGAGLLIRSFVDLQQVRRGYDAHNLLTLRIPPPRRPDLTPQQRAIFLDSLLSEVRALPGVRSAAVVTGLPLGGLNASVTINVEGHSYSGVENMPWANISTISDGYFQTMSTHLVRGRAFEPTDTTTSLPVAIVNQAFVRQYWPAGDPIGKHLGPGTSPNLTVIGVVEDLRQESLQVEQSPTMYVPYSQRKTLMATANFLVVRTASDPATLSEPIVQVIRRLDSGQVIRDVHTMEQVVARSVSQQRALMLLLAVFGSVALLLACAGVFSANHYAVVQRTRELGIRLSLGARRSEILALVVREGMVPVWIGIAIGLTAALLSSRAVAKLLFGISPLDPITFALVATTAVVVSLLALALPAWRATAINPIVALRHD